MWDESSWASPPQRTALSPLSVGVMPASSALATVMSQSASLPWRMLVLLVLWRRQLLRLHMAESRGGRS